MITLWMKKYKSLILYGIFGGLTTVLNIGLYIICTRFFEWGTVLSNSFAWIGGVVFAYITNRKYVFESKEKNMKGIFREFISFVSCRLVTGGLDLLIMYVFVELCQFNDVFIKITANILVIILNYIGSKVIVFHARNNSRADFQKSYDDYEIQGMKRILIVTTVGSFVPHFEINNVRILKKMGYEIHYAANFKIPVYEYDESCLEGIVQHQIDCQRSPYHVNNVKAYFQLKSLMKQYQFEAIHCHTPMGGFLGRLCARACGITKVIYTAHGFHMFRGASIINWLCYYPVEYLLARHTKVLITINQEDYDLACKFKLSPNGIVRKINGVGIDSNVPYLSEGKKEELRLEIGLSKEDYVYITVGELTKRKNQKVLLMAMKSLQPQKHVKLVMCGEGYKHKKLEHMINKLGLAGKVILTGYRRDAIALMQASDCFILPSIQEGLSVSLMEAMSCGLPVICSRIRGNIDLVVEKKGGWLVENAVEEYIKAMKQAMLDSALCSGMGKFNRERIKQYDYKKVQVTMTEIYKKLLTRAEERDIYDTDTISNI